MGTVAVAPSLDHLARLGESEVARGAHSTTVTLHGVERVKHIAPDEVPPATLVLATDAQETYSRRVLLYWAQKGQSHS